MTGLLHEKEFSRKAFLKGGGALIVTVGVAGSAVAGKANAAAPANNLAPDLTQVDTWIAVHADNTVTVFSGKIEYGQGTTTGMRQIAADELDISLAQIHWPRHETGVTPQQGASVGSGGIARGGPQVRAATAGAKQVLLGLASVQLGVPVASLSVADGVVSGGGKTVTYGQLIGDKVFHSPLAAATLNPGQAPAKTVDQYKLVGTRVPRVDIPDKVTGKFTYMHNVRVPGMLHGRVVRPRGQAAWGSGAKPVSLDESSVKGIHGVQLVRKGDFIGVVAPHEYDAIQAAAQLKVTWSDAPTLPGSGNIFKQMRDHDAAGLTTNNIRASAGDVGAGLASAAKVVSATYSIGYQSHAAIGPHCAIADVRGNSATILSSTQDVYGSQPIIGAALGIPAGNINIQYWDSGGTFGSANWDDAAAAAAVMSQAVGKPVRVQFMRWDELGWDPYGPAALADVRAGIDTNGNIVAYDSTAWAHPYVPYQTSETTNELVGVPVPTVTSLGSVDTSQTRYTIPNFRVTGKAINPLKGYLMTSYLRAPMSPQNAFIAEQMIDELAHAARMDPIAFRRKNMTNPRFLTVLDQLVQLAKWEPKVGASSLSKGPVVTGRGVATTGLNAAVADIEVNLKTGKIVAKHIYVVQDPGLAINPALVENQIVGNQIMATSRALVEVVRFTKVRVTSTDFVSNPILRFKDAPGVTALVISTPSNPPSGAGELTHPLPPPAIANAFFDATGVRIREMPMTPPKVLAVLKAAGVA